MKTKNIFKALAFAMLMPAMLLTTACSNDDAIVNNETPAKNGYPLQVTVNVTREGDEGTTRANYNESTRKLEFSAGDKLFVEGTGHPIGGQFAGMLTWQSGTTFSGTIYTQKEYTGTPDAFFAGAGYAATRAYLFPNGYEDYHYLFINESYDGHYADGFDADAAKAFAPSKKLGVEQFSKEMTDSYSGGFSLTPHNAILNFTITGLSASDNVDVTLVNPNVDNITGSVKTDASGTATFAMGIPSGTTNIKDVTLTVDGKTITFTDKNKLLEAGKIYNITKGIVDLSKLEGDYEAKNGDILTNTTTTYKVTIAAGATVTFDNATISGSSYCIKCAGNATIILKDGTTNTLTSTSEDYPALWAGNAGTTLTIQGSTGALNVTSGDNCAGIGSGASSTCGNITITGGTVTATGGTNAAGIGSGQNTSCGDITITNDVTSVTATKGTSATNSIGAGNGGSCGTVTIGGSVTGNITISPYTYTPPVPLTYPIVLDAVTSDYVGSIITTDGYVYATADAANGVGHTPVAMIAYVGSASDCTNGLAISLEEVSSQTLYWDNSGYNNEGMTAAEWCSTWNTSKAVTGGTWRLPSLKDWQYMLIGCGASGSYSDNPSSLSYSELASKLSAAGGTALKSTGYWSSTKKEANVAWLVDFSGSNAVFPGGLINDSGHRVRACLAF